MGKKQPVIQVMWAVPEAVADAQVRETLIQLVRSERYYDLPDGWDVWIHLEEYGAMKDWRWSQALTESAKNGPGFDAMVIAHLGGKLAKHKATEAERKLSKELSRSARKRLPRKAVQYSRIQGSNHYARYLPRWRSTITPSPQLRVYTFDCRTERFSQRPTALCLRVQL